MSPPSTRASDSLPLAGNLIVKKESGRHGDSKRSSESKHVTKSVDTQRTSINPKHSKDVDKKSESKKQQDKLGDVKQEYTKPCSKQNDTSKDIAVSISVSPTSHAKPKSTSASPTRTHVDKRKHDISPSRSENKDTNVNKCDKESDQSITSSKSDSKRESPKCKSGHTEDKECVPTPATLTTVTLTSGQSVTSPQSSPKSGGVVAQPLSGGGKLLLYFRFLTVM